MAESRPGTPDWWLTDLYRRLRRRTRNLEVWRRYYRGEHPLPVGPAGATAAYRDFQRKARTALSLSTAYVSVGPHPRDPDRPLITAEHPAQVITADDPATGERVAALKTWYDPTTQLTRATVFTPEAITRYTSEQRTPGRGPRPPGAGSRSSPTGSARCRWCRFPAGRSLAPTRSRVRRGPGHPRARRRGRDRAVRGGRADHRLAAGADRRHLLSVVCDRLHPAVHRRPAQPDPPGCDCAIAPITGTDRHVLDRQLLAAATTAAAGLIGHTPTRDQLRDVLLSITREHGEHGSVLGPVSKSGVAPGLG